LLAPGPAGPAAEPPLPLVLAGAALFGALAGAGFGAAQWTALRHHTPDARRWIGANALGWAIGLPWSYLAGASIDGSSPAQALAIAALAGAAMGLSVAVVTGVALVRLVGAHPLLHRRA
jgi:hypothetical protein